MMRTIFKYALAIQDEPQVIELPKGAKIRYVAIKDMHGTMICLWAEFAPMWDRAEVEFEERMFYVIRTGNAIPEDTQYVGTAQIPSFVWHVYEQLKIVGEHDIVS